jgi:hypothetical protein
MEQIYRQYVIEVKSSLQNFVKVCEEYNMSYDTIKGILELLICLDKNPHCHRDVLEMLFSQLPELYHIKPGMEFIENISQLFSGSMGNLLSEQEDELIEISKNFLKEEMYKLHILKATTVCNGDDVLNSLEAFSI